MKLHETPDGVNYSVPSVGGDYLAFAAADFHLRRLLPVWLDAAGHPNLAAQFGALSRIGGWADLPRAFDMLERAAAALEVETSGRADLPWRDACRGPQTHDRVARMARRLAEIACARTPPAEWCWAQHEVELLEGTFLAGGWR